MRWVVLIVLCAEVGLSPLSTPAQEQATVTTVDFEQRLGHIVLEARINGTPKKLILDTGGNTTLLTAQAAKELELEELTGEATPRASGVNISYVRVDSLAIGGLVRSGLVCHVAEIPHLTAIVGDDVAGLLGHDFLSQYTITIDYRRKRLSLEWHREQDSLFVDAQYGLEVRRPDNSWAFRTCPPQPTLPLYLTKTDSSAEVIVTVGESQNHTLDQLVPLIRRSVRVGAESSSARTTYGDKDCYVLRFARERNGVRNQCMLAVFVEDQSLCSVLCSAEPDEFADRAEEFDSIVASIRFLQQDEAEQEPAPTQRQEDGPETEPPVTTPS